MYITIESLCIFIAFQKIYVEPFNMVHIDEPFVESM